MNRKKSIFKKKFTKAEQKEEMRKMYAGEPYIGGVPLLYEMRSKAKSLCFKFNQTKIGKRKTRMAILKKLFGKTGEWVMAEPPFHCDYGCNIRVGEWFYMNTGCVILDHNIVEIGDNVMFGPLVQIYAVNHPVDAKERMEYKMIGLPVKIGNKVWIGGGAIILAGVTIGDNTTIGAGSVVTKSIPANVFAAGNPCRVIRRLKTGK